MNDQTALTKRDLATLGIDALDKDRAGRIAVSHIAGGVSFASALEVMEFAKLMAISGSAVPDHLRANPGICLAVTFQAIEWRMSPFAVANKSYVVKDRLAFESQLLHGVVEARAPLAHRLDCRYGGEGAERTCTVIGEFNGGDVREYTSPMIKDIKVKNSPLWSADPDQQLFYYASRSWARKWCPDVLLGVYSREELQENESIGREETSPGLHARLAGSSATQSGEGFKDGHAHSELDQIGSGGKVEVLPPDKGEPAKAEDPRPDKKTAKKAEAKKTDAKKPAKGSAPTDADEYAESAKAWIAAEKDADNLEARWDGERELRETLGVPIKMRTELSKLVDARAAELRG